MPANLSAQYIAAEERFREASTIEEKIECLREMMAVIPKHKGTEKLQADLKRRLSKLQQDQEQQRKSGGGRKDPGHVPREGAGQVVLLGPPNAGKSSLLAAMTNARPEIAGYPFTTHMPQPGMLPYKDIQIQLVDSPPVATEPFDPMHITLARGADVILILLDPFDIGLLDHVELLPKLLARCRIIPMGRPVPEELTLAGRVLPVHLAINKIDLAAQDRMDDLVLAIDLVQEGLGRDIPMHRISAANGSGLGDLGQALFETLSIVRVYSKEPGKKTETDKPFVLAQGSTVIDLARIIHKDLVQNYRFARIWGSARFDGQPVERDHALQDGDIVEIHA